MNVGESTTAFINRAIDERIERENPLPEAPVASNIKEPKPPKERSDTVSQSEARKKANEKYLKCSVEDIRIRVPKGNKVKIQEHAANMGESMNSFVIRAICETIEHDNQKE